MTKGTIRSTLIGASVGALLAVGPMLPASAGLEEGVAAYQAGEFQTALAELKPLADQGNAQAQYLVGRIYAYGQGTLRHYSLAHTYLTLAANQGVTEALLSKANISDNLSQRDIIESMRRQDEMLYAIETGTVQTAAPAQAGAAPAGQAGAATATTEQAAAADEPAGGDEVAVAQQDDGIDQLSRRDLVREIQTELNRLGYSAGTPDGLYGPSTRGAIQKFQADADMGRDGEATPDLLRALRSAQPG